jgi:hypothetical protein
MKYTLAVLTAVMGLGVGNAWGQYPGAVAPAGPGAYQGMPVPTAPGAYPGGAAAQQYAMPPGDPYNPAAQPSRYGFNSYFSRFFGKKDCDCNGKKKKPGYVPPPPPPPADHGTLVFPNHQFIRSPRDFFMMGERGPAYGE